MNKVTNISKTLRVLYDKGGKKVELKPGESVNMIHPPKEHYAFKIDKSNNIEKKEESKEKKEGKKKSKNVKKKIKKETKIKQDGKKVRTKGNGSE